MAASSEPPRLRRAVASAPAELAVVVPVVHGQRGHPVRFAAHCGPELLQLQGPQGAAAVVRARSAGEQGADYRSFERAQACANDAFRFTGLPDGSWFLISPVKAGDDIMVVMKRVQTRGGRMISVTLGS